MKNRTKPKLRKPGKTATNKQHATGAYRFEKGRGKTVEFVEFHTDSGHHVLEIRFEDQTTLYFIIEPCEPAFSVEPTYSRWKDGNERILKRWAPVYCS